jgi:hypothetical protein
LPSLSEIALVGAGKKNGASPESEPSPFLSCILFLACRRRGWHRQAGTLLSVQLRCLGVMMSCTLTITMSQVCVVRRLFMLLGLIVFGGLVEMVGRLLMMASGVMVMLPSR